MNRNMKEQVKRFTLTFVVSLMAGLTVLIWQLTKWVQDTWTDIGMEEIVFHLKSPIEGTNEEMISEAVERCVPSTVLLFFMVFVVFWCMKEKTKLRNFLVIGVLGFSFICSPLAVVATAETYGLSDYLNNQSETSEFLTENYVDPRKVELTFPEEKRNLIYIFLESMEATYSSRAEGGAYRDNYIPELTELAKANINFSSTDKLGGGKTTVGSTWTIGGMFSQTSGIPLLIPVEGNSMNEQEAFFPQITTLGDVLKEEGYRQMLLVGSEAEFGGRENYFSSHGDYEMWDYNTAIEEEKIAEDYRVFWGYEDEKLFEYAKENLLDLANGSEPFNLTMLTVDTHFEDGYSCHLCGDEFEGQYGNVIHCSSRQVTEFIEWIQAQYFYENTTIVVVGDHLTMDSDFCEKVSDSYSREVYNTFINSAVETENEKNRDFTTLDMYPTTLASLGVQIEGDRLGLGTNLFSGTSTLAEIYGFEEMNDELSKKSVFYDYLTQDLVVEED